jgi:hypothetical protein
VQTPEWLTFTETCAFIGMVGMGIYKRILNWRKFQDRTTALEIAFKQYQIDQKLFLDAMRETFASYMKTCETCRAEVRSHHEQDTKHVTIDMRAQINNMASEISEIKTYLMENK